MIPYIVTATIATAKGMDKKNQILSAFSFPKILLTVGVVKRSIKNDIINSEPGMISNIQSVCFALLGLKLITKSK